MMIELSDEQIRTLSSYMMMQELSYLHNATFLSKNSDVDEFYWRDAAKQCADILAQLPADKFYQESWEYYCGRRRMGLPFSQLAQTARRFAKHAGLIQVRISEVLELNGKNHLVGIGQVGVSQ